MTLAQPRVLITGATGMLGTALVDAWLPTWGITALVHSHRVHHPDVKNVAGDLARPDTLSGVVAQAHPHLVVHCAAITNLDACEAQPELATLVHVDATRALANAAREHGARFVYVSTDSMFSSDARRHREEDAVAPLSTYARTKLEGERAALDVDPTALILRTCIYGWNSQATNVGFAEWIVRELRARRGITGFTDVWFTPILTNALVRAMTTLVERSAAGLFHVGGATCVTKYDFARAVANAFGLPASLIRAGAAADAALAAPRPLYPCLDSTKYEKLTGQTLPTLEEGILEFRGLEESGWAASIHRLTERCGS